MRFSTAKLECKQCPIEIEKWTFFTMQKKVVNFSTYMNAKLPLFYDNKMHESPQKINAISFCLQSHSKKTGTRLLCVAISIYWIMYFSNDTISISFFLIFLERVLYARKKNNNVREGEEIDPEDGEPITVEQACVRTFGTSCNIFKNNSSLYNAFQGYWRPLTSIQGY